MPPRNKERERERERREISSWVKTNLMWMEKRSRVCLEHEEVHVNMEAEMEPTTRTTKGGPVTTSMTTPANKHGTTLESMPPGSRRSEHNRSTADQWGGAARGGPQ